jgi:hypothetical protein
MSCKVFQNPSQKRKFSSQYTQKSQSFYKLVHVSEERVGITPTKYSLPGTQEPNT